MSNNKELHAAQDLNQALQHEFKVRRICLPFSPPPNTLEFVSPYIRTGPFLLFTTRDH
jgi:hypothetical protein